MQMAQQMQIEVEPEEEEEEEEPSEVQGTSGIASGPVNAPEHINGAYVARHMSCLTKKVQ